VTAWLVLLSGPVLLTIVATALAVEGRSGKWSSVRDAYVAAHPTCEACGAKRLPTVHHVLPFHLWPEHELDPANLITLCPTCHLLFGHLGDYKASNPCVREDAARHLAEVKARPYTRDDKAKFIRQFSTAP